MHCIEMILYIFFFLIWTRLSVFVVVWTSDLVGFVLLQYIKKMISRGSNPVLSLVTKATVDVDFATEEYYMPSLPKKEKPKTDGI